jgi:myosin heavy subunit
MYMLCKGLPPQAKQKYRLKNVLDYMYLNQSGCTDVDGMSDEEEFMEVAKAMEQLNFSQQEIDSLFFITSGVLQLGNMSFQSTGDRKCVIKDKNALADAASILQVDKAKLESVCITRLMTIQGQQPIVVNLSDQEAKAARDALAKFIYEKMFDWIVDRVNRAIGQAQKGRSIGILDIFGFEIFKTNSFEQLCIVS